MVIFPMFMLVFWGFVLLCFSPDENINWQSGNPITTSRLDGEGLREERCRELLRRYIVNQIQGGMEGNDGEYGDVQQTTWKNH